MKIYLARHAEYASSLQGELSAHGIEQVNYLNSLLISKNLRVAHIYHSGLLRAEQTAELLSKSFHSEEAIEYKAGLNPVDDINPLLHEISHGSQDILIVGHLPYLSKLISKMVVDDEYKDILNIRPATLVCLEHIEDVRWIINWVLAPL